MKRIFWATILLIAIMTSNLSAQDRGDTWPPANILRQFGIEGMPQPAGTSEVYWRGDWAEVSEGARAVTRGNPALLIGLRGTNATGNAIKDWFDRNGWALISREDRVYNAGDYQYIKGSFIAYFDFSDGTGQIVAGVIPEVGKNSLLYGTWVNPSNGHTLIFSMDGWEWVEWFGGEYVYDGTNLKLTYIDYNTDEEYTTTTTVTISGSTITVGRFSGGVYVDFFNSDLPGRFTKQ